LNREDDQQPTAGIAITYINNRELSRAARILGFKATDFDADLCAHVSAAHQPGKPNSSSTNFPSLKSPSST
jgi:hypothetical protein